MLEKADAETGTFGGALNQAGDVDHHERTAGAGGDHARLRRSEEHTSELQSLMRISYAVFCLKKKKKENYKYNNIRSQIKKTSKRYTKTTTTRQTKISNR